MWLAKLKRMMDELPEQYLQPYLVNPEDFSLIPVGSKPVSQLTEEEKRLRGVVCQLNDSILREDEAHRALHDQGMAGHSQEACFNYQNKMMLKEKEVEVIAEIFYRSLEERLGYENFFIIDGYDIYAVPYKKVTCNQPMPDDFNIPEFNDWPKTKH